MTVRKGNYFKTNFHTINFVLITQPKILSLSNLKTNTSCLNESNNFANASDVSWNCCIFLDLHYLFRTIVLGNNCWQNFEQESSNWIEVLPQNNMNPGACVHCWTYKLTCSTFQLHRVTCYSLRALCSFTPQELSCSLPRISFIAHPPCL